MGGGGRYGSKLIFGVNRYYGRNLLSYRLYEFGAAYETYSRPDQNTPWAPQTNINKEKFAFNKLNVPYADEVMIGFTQNIYMFELVGKYIYRGGRDEVMQVKQDKTNKNSPTTWSNDGKSESHIVTLNIQNAKALEFYDIKNYALLAFDWTNVKRSYNLYDVDDAYFNDDDIIYNGQIIKYRDRPVENFARPFTIRLATTHIFNIWKTRWTYNNFFRYRGGYDAMVLLNKTSPGWNPNYPDTKQYGKMHFDGAFTWDIRIGFEIDVYKGHTLYCNLDIYNVLDTKNMTALSVASTGAISPGIPSSSSVAVYEIGRQFWLQVGYKI